MAKNCTRPARSSGSGSSQTLCVICLLNPNSRTAQNGTHPAKQPSLRGIVMSVVTPANPCWLAIHRKSKANPSVLLRRSELLIELGLERLVPRLRSHRLIEPANSFFVESAGDNHKLSTCVSSFALDQCGNQRQPLAKGGSSDTTFDHGITIGRGAIQKSDDIRKEQATCRLDYLRRSPASWLRSKPSSSMRSSPHPKEIPLGMTAGSVETNSTSLPYAFSAVTMR